jgi:Zn-dependent alcohol dehydrogenase
VWPLRGDPGGGHGATRSFLTTGLIFSGFCFLFGSSNPFDDIPRILDLYRAGKLKLSELITTRYTLDQVNQGYEDMLAGRSIRGVIIRE